MDLATIDDSGGRNLGAIRLFARAAATMSSSFKILFRRGTSAVYLSLNAGPGMWLTVLNVAAARVRGRRLVIHHHTYGHLDVPVIRARALMRAAGPAACHVTLSPSMTTALKATYPRARLVIELTNAGLVDDISPQNDGPAGAKGLRIGLLSNLTEHKGILELEILTEELVARGLRPLIRVGGPARDSKARSALERMQASFGGNFDYWGQVSNQQKETFFSDLTHFVFLTRYANEASPLVVLEALAANVRVVAFNQGAIVDLIDERSGICIQQTDRWVDDVVAALVDQGTEAATPRARYEELRTLYTEQLDRLRDFLSATPTSEVGKK
ncbi:glycosyltransferase [Microbacterium sp. 179-I 1D1 NHS]|uniref:glycosyltransferase n=1 Tax=unclassified Microbacterium TaxID=2609290 RepID=UPI003879E0F1